MSIKTIQIADKSTLDETKALLENSEYGLKAIKNGILNNPSNSAGGLQIIGEIIDESITGNVSISTLPYNFYDGSAVVYNNEIHILGGTGNRTAHYKYNGTSWESVSTLPYNFCQGSAVVLNNEIHILGSDYVDGSDSSAQVYHYKFDGSSWTSVSRLPYPFYGGSAVIYNNEIHILGGYRGTKAHYKYNGSSWTSVSTLPYEFYGGAAVVLNNKIHILGGNGNSTKHYKFDGSSWTSVSTLPYEFYGGAAVIYNDEIHILGSADSGCRIDHYKFNGKEWTKRFNIPFTPENAVIYNNEIHTLYNVSHYTIKNDYRHIMTLLPNGMHILLPENEDILYVSDNAIIEENNIAKITSSGSVEIIAEFTDQEDMETYLAFY